ncbi:MAG: hypothetical protein ACRELG_11615 [Gemmataceae bacterium]
MSDVPDLTKEQLSNSRVIARGRGIREIGRLVGQYGGTIKGWTKKSTQPLTIAGRPAEVHWYEHHGIGRVEEKIKWLD